MSKSNLRIASDHENDKQLLLFLPFNIHTTKKKKKAYRTVRDMALGIFITSIFFFKFKKEKKNEPVYSNKK